MNSGPMLLIDWEPRWRGFTSAIGPALSSSDNRLQLECDGPPTTPRSLACSLALHLLFFTVLWKIPAATQPSVVLKEEFSPTEITYYAGSDLPQMQAESGAEAGASGHSGGNEGFHPTQIIRVSRGRAAQDKNLDAPPMQLRKHDSQLANLIALADAATPAPPTQALQRKLKLAQELTEAHPEVVQPAVENPKLTMAEARPLSLTPNVVQPAPQKIVRDSLSISKLVLPQEDAVQPPPDTAKLTLPRKLAPTELASAAIQPVPDTSAIRSNQKLPADALSNSAIQPMPGLEQTAHLNHAPEIPAYAENASPKVTGTGAGESATLAGTGPGNGTGGDKKLQAVVITANPGSKIGLPAKSENGSVALSPAGHGDKGMGGSGGGTGIGKGVGPGSAGVGSGSGSGSGRTGAGPGSDLNAKNGTSKKAGPGGTGDGEQTASLSGITISGGSVTIGSFAPANVPISNSPAKILGPRHPPAITVVGSSTAGGALNRYGALKGGKVYTIYIQTRLGTAVLEYAEQALTSGSFQADLTAPEPVQSDIPPDVRNSRMVVACVIGSDGILRNLRVLESGATEMTAKVVLALQEWRFRPVLRGDEAIAVDAILGFDIDTR